MITVLTIAFNQKKYTEMLMASLALADCADTDFEIVFIDNGSTDGTQEMVMEFPVQKNPHFRGMTYFSFSENRGVAAAINKGFELAKSEYVLQADNDVIFGPHSLSIMFDWMTKYPHGMISPNWPAIQKKLGIRFFEDIRDLTPSKLKKLEKTGFKCKFEPFRATGSCWMCSKSLFKHIGGWDEAFRNICASDDFLWKVAVSGTERYTIPCPVYHPGKVTRGRIPGNSVQQEKDLARFMDKWKGHPEDKKCLRAHQNAAGVPVDPEPELFWLKKLLKIHYEGK